MGLPQATEKIKEFLGKNISAFGKAMSKGTTQSTFAVQCAAPPWAPMRDLQLLAKALRDQNNWFRHAVVFEPGDKEFAKSKGYSATIAAIGEAAMGTVLSQQEQQDAHDIRSTKWVVGEQPVFPQSPVAFTAGIGSGGNDITVEGAARAVGMGLDGPNRISTSGQLGASRPWSNHGRLLE